ncbi:hypothetical protein ACGFK1_26100 [Mycobacterium sp. NPDC048908]|uniref:hypothetical protein n=1 Tax=Mycobacterium sp. NPDC048908 TaxID=3364292 RepID=UPI003717BCA4
MLITAAAVVALVAGMPSATAQSTCEGLGGTVDVDQVCHVQSTTTAYAIDISFPLGYPDQQAVADHLKQGRADFLNWVTKFGGDSRQYMHDVTAKTYQSSGTRSLVLTVIDDTGFAHEDHLAPHTRRSTTTRAGTHRSPSTRCSSQGPTRQRCSTPLSNAN